MREIYMYLAVVLFVLNVFHCKYILYSNSSLPHLFTLKKKICIKQLDCISAIKIYCERYSHSIIEMKEKKISHLQMRKKNGKGKQK